MILTNRTMVSSAQTQKAAKKFTRRTILKRSLAVGGTIAAAGPWIVQDAFSSSGSLNIMIWSDYLPEKFVKKFEASTGITIRHTSYGSNEELINKIKATKGRGYDLVSPSNDRSNLWKDLELLSLFDMNRVPADKIIGSMMKISTEFSWDSVQRHLPYLWGTEAVAWRTDLWESEYGKLSYGDLWGPEVKGRVMGRPHSMMAGIGRYLERIGELPPFIEAYENEDKMRSIWDVITAFAIDHKPWIKLFWNDAETQENGLLHNAVMIGQTWDGPPLRLQKAGKPVQFMAPIEGAFTWLDGLSIPVGAKNIDAIYEFINFIYTPETGGLLANQTGYNSVCDGAEQHISEQQKKVFASAYPGDALDRLWAWPTTPLWYSNLRQEYSDRFIVA